MDAAPPTLLVTILVTILIALMSMDNILRGACIMAGTQVRSPTIALLLQLQLKEMAGCSLQAGRTKSQPVAKQRSQNIQCMQSTILSANK